jgi:hypothetical protein
LPKYKPSLRMIQRIQSLLLAGVVILLTINLFVPIWSESQNNTSIVLTAFNIRYGAEPASGTLISMINKEAVVYYSGILMSVCIGLTLFIIFQYKNRNLQIKLCSLLILLILGIIGTYFLTIPTAKTFINQSTGGEYEIGYFLPIISSLLVMASRYYIKKDEELVRSVDRLR